jgi:hypothetical protein
LGVRWFGIFFGNGHGEGTHNGARTDIKHFIRHEQLNLHGTKLQNAKEVVNFLCANLFDHPKSSYLGKKKTNLLSVLASCIKTCWPQFWNFWM